MKGRDKGKDVHSNETSGNREESMTESGEDGFGRGGAVRKESGSQSGKESGTTPLGGETREDEKDSGGIEGTE